MNDLNVLKQAVFLLPKLDLRMQILIKAFQHAIGTKNGSMLKAPI